MTDCSVELYYKGYGMYCFWKWIPACAGMTKEKMTVLYRKWIPACAGMTKDESQLYRKLGCDGVVL